MFQTLETQQPAQSTLSDDTHTTFASIKRCPIIPEHWIKRKARDRLIIKLSGKTSQQQILFFYNIFLSCKSPCNRVNWCG